MSNCNKPNEMGITLIEVTLMIALMSLALVGGVANIRVFAAQNFSKAQEQMRAGGTCGNNTCDQAPAPAPQ